jgi:DNA modification methylase
MITVNKKIKSLVEAEYNPRKLSENQKQHITDSIKRFGIVDPIIINVNKDRKNIIIGGHQRVRVAKTLGYEELPCVELDLSRDQERELNIRLNKNTGEFDYEILNELFDIDELLDWGFTEDELEMFEEPESDGLTDDDEIPEVDEPICKLGELWKLGDHKLLCGDATKPDDVERLMDGQKADMVFTDPPYGVAVNSGGIEDLKARNRRTDRLVVKNDDLKDDELHPFLVLAFNNYFKNMKDGGVIYVCHAEALGKDVIFRTAFVECGFKPAEIIIWVKDQFAFGRQDYHWRHEPIIYGWKEGAAHYFIDDHTQDTVWNIARPKKSKLHPTTKPIELVEKAVNNSSRIRNLILDLFLGSGSTLIACEKTNRKCYGMEIDPHYCDVIIKRWEDFTGRTAEIV